MAKNSTEKYIQVLKNIFQLSSEEDFRTASLETFLFQYESVEVYRKFVDFLRKKPSEIHTIEEIPFLPIELFKNHRILNQKTSTNFYFQSSGTTEMLNRSKHFISDLDLYQQSIYKGFSQFLGPPEEFVFLGLLPNYSENPHSSLIYMVDFLMKKSQAPENGYFLYDHTALFDRLEKLEKEQKKVVLFGVSFALLDYLEYCQIHILEHSKNSFLTVIETGGMKGRKQEMNKEEMLDILKSGFHTQQIFSEYSMTELLSQAYSLGDLLYETPPWMRILIRNTEDPFSYLAEGKTGAINIIDLANQHSCSFIATQDLGKKIGKKFKVLGRIDHSDIRGCSLLVS